MMDQFSSGSIDLTLTLEDIVSHPSFEETFKQAYATKRYSLKSSVKTPYWTYCSVSGMLIRLFHSSEILVIDEIDFDRAYDEDLVECVTGDSLIYLPKKNIEIGEWH